MAYKDLREFIEQVDEIGELKSIEGADWNLEIGAIGEMSPDSVLFDRIKGYPKGHRALVNATRSIPRWLLGVNMKSEARENALAREWRDRLHNFTPIHPREVERGPVTENVMVGKEVDVLKFPVPKIHPEDAGRYIGTADAVITRDPDTGRINFGTFRIQVHDKDTLGLYICHGKDTALILEEYRRRKEVCPVVALVGIEPAIFESAHIHLPHSGMVSEYDYAGWLKGEPMEVIKGQFTGLPIPARAEIAIEGEVLPDEARLEGPFGEWTGYSEPRESYVIRIKAIYHRNEPILTIQSPSGPTRPPARGNMMGDPRVAGFLWAQLERAGARGIVGVAVYQARFLEVVSIRNRYAGQARQAGHLATQVHAGAFMGKYTIVVDEEIDPYNIDQVLWAMLRTADPQRAIDIVRYCWSDRMDCALPYEARPTGAVVPPVYNSRCVIDACRPVEWDPKLKRPVEYPDKLKEQIHRKHGATLFPKPLGEKREKERMLV